MAYPRVQTLSPVFTFTDAREVLPRQAPRVSSCRYLSSPREPFGNLLIILDIKLTLSEFLKNDCVARTARTPRQPPRASTKVAVLDTFVLLMTGPEVTGMSVSCFFSPRPV